MPKTTQAAAAPAKKAVKKVAPAAAVEAVPPVEAKAPAKKAAVKKAAAAAEAPAEEKSGLSKNQVVILKSLLKKPLTRPEIKEATGIQGGLAKLMGAPTREGFGAGGDKTLESLGLIESSKEEGARALTYTITDAGREAVKGL